MNAARKNVEATAVLDPWMTVPQAARAIGIANATVSSLALRGELRTQIVAGRTVVDRESVADYVARRDAAKAE